MDKMYLISYIVMVVAIPTLGARHHNPRKGLLLSVIFLVVFNCIFVMGLIYIWPRLA